MASAHNFSSNSLSAYHLVCDLQFQNQVDLRAWDWGDLSSEIYLPRIMYKSAVLSSARWLITRESLGIERPNDLSEFEDHFSDFRRKYTMPNYVIYAESDNTLLIDISRSLGIEQLFQFFKKKKYFVLTESLWNEDSMLLATEPMETGIPTNSSFHT